MPVASAKFRFRKESTIKQLDSWQIDTGQGQKNNKKIVVTII